MMSTIANAIGALKTSAPAPMPTLRVIPDAKNFSARTVYKGKASSRRPLRSVGRRPAALREGLRL
jgi:hypothetical protein